MLVPEALRADESPWKGDEEGVSPPRGQREARGVGEVERLSFFDTGGYKKKRVGLSQADALTNHIINNTKTNNQ